MGRSETLTCTTLGRGSTSSSGLRVAPSQTFSTRTYSWMLLSNGQYGSDLPSKLSVGTYATLRLAAYAGLNWRTMEPNATCQTASTQTLHYGTSQFRIHNFPMAKASLWAVRI